ncbi:MAG: stealth conserved region 3 domain-containing protein, partial [Alistipes sp.]|nr:stealth conserved region 3 domain-containing protein [Alistipes sp.]
ITLCIPHNAQPYLKSTFEEVWAVAEKELTETSANRFRARTDYSPELFRTWQICKGNFEPYNTYRDTKMFPLMMRPKQAVRAIYEQTYNLICLNDNVHIRNYEQVMEHLKAAFEHILSEKSSFELR